jgi:hypothetical protein
MKNLGYFIMDDGSKSSDHQKKVKLKKRSKPTERDSQEDIGPNKIQRTE